MSLSRRITAAAALSGLALSGTAGCGAIGFDAPGQNSFWQEPNSYAYTLEAGGGERALLGKYRITVRDRKVAEAEGLDDYADRIVAEMPDIVPTIGDLLPQLEQVRRGRGDTADVEYAEDGHPRRIVLDPIKDAIDDEATYVITDYKQLHQSPDTLRDTHGRDTSVTSQAWSATPKAQASIQAIGEFVAQEFGETSKDNDTGPLSRGYIGTTLDDATETVVVVVDPNVVDIQSLTERMSSAPGVDGVSLRVRPGAFTVAELLEARAVISERAWHPRAAQVAFAFHLDAADSRFQVSFSPKDEDVAQTLAARLGDRVRIKWGAPQGR